MERVCFEVQVRADRLDGHRERHEAMWPEMLAARPLERFEAAQRAMQETGVNARRPAQTAPPFECLEGVFHLD
jgi:L-rhamnose mutarotase